MVSTTSPTFSSLPTPNHISPLTNSSPHRTSTGTFPDSSPTPCSPRQNSVPIIDALLCFTFLVSDPSHSSTSPLVCWFPFLSRMLSPLDSLQLLCNHYAAPAPDFISPFAHLSYSHWLIPSHTISPFPFTILSFHFFLVCAPHCTVYKTPAPVSCSLASSTHFSLVSSLPRFALRPTPSEAFPHLERLS